MTTNFAPRACGDDAWKDWYRQARTLVLRGWGTWLPLHALLLIGVTGLMAINPGSFVMTVVLLLLPMLLWGIQLAVAESLAQGETSLGAIVRAISEDIHAHGRRYFREFMVFAAFVLVCGGMFMLLFTLVEWAMGPSTSTPVVDRPAAPAWIEISARMQVWLLYWMLCQSVFAPRAMGFYAQLAWKAGIPTSISLKLDLEAFEKNQASLTRVRWMMLGSVLVAIFIPFSSLLIELFWTAVNRCSYADIFDQSPGVKAPKTVAVDNPNLAALPA